MSRPKKGTAKVAEPKEFHNPRKPAVHSFLSDDGSVPSWLLSIEELGQATRELGNAVSYPEVTVVIAAWYLRTRGTPGFWSTHRAALRGIHSALGEGPPTMTVLATGKAVADGTDIDPPPPVATWIEGLDTILATEELVAQWAMEKVESAGYRYDAEEGVLTAATGRRGNPPEHFTNIVWNLYKRATGYPQAKGSDLYAVKWRKLIADKLRLFFPAPWLSTKSDGKEAKIANIIRNGTNPNRNRRKVKPTQG